MGSQTDLPSYSIPFAPTDEYIDELVQTAITNTGISDLEVSTLKEIHGEGLVRCLGVAVIQGYFMVDTAYRTAELGSRLYPARLSVMARLLREGEESTQLNKVDLLLTEEGRNFHRRHFPLPTDSNHVR